MKKTFLAAAALFALATPTMAADMAARPMYTKAPPLAAVSNWNGWYVGGNVGAVYADWDRSGFYDTFAVSDHYNDWGATAGGQIGYNWQFSPTALFGIETDLNWMNVGKFFNNAAGFSGGAPNDPTSTQSYKNNWVGTTRARLGWVNGMSLWYVTGGVAYGNTKVFINDSGTNLGTIEKTSVGWTAGAGYEAFFATNWTWKVEYLYIDLGKVQFDHQPPAFTISERTTESLIRLGVNYKF